jgi:DNA repair exonuclease SbcCD ATPase subunit
MLYGGNIALQAFLLINILIVGAVIALAVVYLRAHLKEKSEPKKVEKPEALPILPSDARRRILHDAEEDYQEVLKRSALELQRNLETTTQRLNEQLDKMGTNIVSDEMERYKHGLDDLRKETENAVGSASAEIQKHQTELRAKLLERQAEVEAKIREQEAELEAKLAARTTELEETFKQRQAEFAKKQAELESELLKRQSELDATVKEREASLAKRQAELDEELVRRQKEHADKQAALAAKLEQDMAAEREKAATALETKIGDTIATFLTETLGHNVDLGAQTAYLTSVLEEHKDDLVKGLRDDA